MRADWWDYAQANWYFVTICTQNRRELFGVVADGAMELNDAGQIVESCWNRIPERFPDVGLDAFVVMPNHVHGLVILGDDGEITLPRVVHWFKTQTTTAYIRGVKQYEWPRFDRHLWQRSFYDQIRRSDRHISNVRRYIDANPTNWVRDDENDSRFLCSSSQAESLSH